MDEKPLTTTKTLPMTIVINNKTEQYSLFNTHFDPIQNSPPNSWKKRLNKRVGLVKSSS